MSVLKTIVVGILGIVATMMIISVFIPSQVHLERKIVIHAPKVHVFQQVNNLHNWENWFSRLLTGSQIMYKDAGNDNGIGAAVEWTNSRWISRAIITQNLPFEVVEITIKQNSFDPYLSIFKFEEISNRTYVSWSMQRDMGKSPYQKYRGVFMDKILGPEMTESLKNLKNYIEGDFYK